MKYTYRQVLDSYPKNHQESLFTRYFCRPISFAFAYLLANIGCSAWLVSVLSVIVALMSCTFLCFSYWFRWVGILLAVLWLIMDCVDGTIARVTKSYSAMGDFIDAQSGYTIMAFIFFFFFLAAYNTTEIFAEYAVLFIIIGAVSSISNILARLLNAKYSYCELEQKIRKKVEVKLISYDEPEGIFAKARVWVDFNIGLVGLFMPFMVVAQLTNTFDILTIFYCLYSVAGLVVASAYYAYKAK